MAYINQICSTEPTRSWAPRKQAWLLVRPNWTQNNEDIGLTTAFSDLNAIKIIADL